MGFDLRLPQDGEAGDLVRVQSTLAFAALHGPLRVSLENGTNITPGSPVRQALLAVLLTAPGQVKSRRALQDMFWGSAGVKKGSANLRSAIYALKADLRGLGQEIITADRSTIGLVPGVFRVLPKPADGGDFLEGLDLQLQDCELFEDWLRDQRTREATNTTRPSLANPPLVQATHRDVALGLIATRHSNLREDEFFSAEGFVDQIARTLSVVSTLAVHDLRSCDTPSVDLPIESGAGATHVLQALVEKKGPELQISVRLLETWTYRLIWVSEVVELNQPELDTKAAAVAEQLLAHLASQVPDPEFPDLFAWTAITGLFSLDRGVVSRVETQLTNMLSDGGPSELRCVLHFAQVFKENEGVAKASSIEAPEICDPLAFVPDHDPMLPLWESLAGYSAHMLLGDNELAEALISDSFQRAPNLALNLDHLAVLRLAKGDLIAARHALRRCLKCGDHSPWRYTYDVTGAIVTMADGDFRTSLSHANRALMRKPRFVGALRYAMLGFALSGNTKDAKRMKQRIETLRPGYDFDAWTERMIQRTPSPLATRLADGLQTH